MAQTIIPNGTEQQLAPLTTLGDLAFCTDTQTLRCGNGTAQKEFPSSDKVAALAAPAAVRAEAASATAVASAQQIANQLMQSVWPGVSLDGDTLYVYDAYGLGDAFRPGPDVDVTVGWIATASIDGDALFVYDSYGLGDAVEGGTSSAPVAPVVTSALLPADFDAIGAWHTHAQGALFRNEQAVVSIISDSQYVFGNGRGAVPLTQRLRAKYGNGGPGWSSPPSSALPSDPSYPDGEVSFGGAGGGFSQSSSPNSPNQLIYTNSTAGTTTTLTYSGTATIATVDLIHGGGGGTISYNYGGASTQIALPSAPGKVALAAPPAGGGWTLTFQIVSGTFIYAGCDLRTGKGVVVHNLAIGGTTAQSWTAPNQAQWRASLALLGMHASIVSLGGNDETANRTGAQFTADMQTLIASVRANDPAIDIIISVRGQTFRAGGVTLRMAEYAAAMRAIGPSLTAAVYEAGKRFGTSPSEYSYSPTGTRFVALQDDNLHFNQLGRDIFVSGPCELLGA